MSQTYRTMKLESDEIECIRKLVENLSPRSRQVLELRYGLDAGHPERTWIDIGRTMGVSKSHACHLESIAIRSLRSPSIIKKLPPVHEICRYRAKGWFPIQVKQCHVFTWFYRHQCRKVMDALLKMGFLKIGVGHYKRGSNEAWTTDYLSDSDHFCLEASKLDASRCLRMVKESEGAGLYE